MTRHLLVIGAQRCGTTYLASLLDAHPDVAMARPARPEPKVFLTDEVSRRGLDWYRATYFGHASSEAVWAEKSTSYIEDPLAADRVGRMLGTPLILALLRDPIARAVSNWRFSTEHGKEERPLVQALEENLAGPRPWDRSATSVSPFAYLERGRYIEHLSPWVRRFPGSSSVHFFEELTTNEASVSQLYSALGVDNTFRPPAFGHAVNASPGCSPNLPTSLVKDLRAYYRESDARLGHLLRRRLPWEEALPAKTDCPTAESR